MIIIKKENSPFIGFTVPADHKVNIKERENREKYLDLVSELKWVSGILIVIGELGTVHKGLKRRLEELEFGGNQEHRDNRMIGQNTAKIPVNLRRLAVTQTPEKDHQLTQVIKKIARSIIVMIIINWSLAIGTNGICTTQNLSWRMTQTLSSGILRYKRIT